MVSFLTTKRSSRPPKQPHSRRTSISFSQTDLAELGHLVAIGQTVWKKRPAVMERVKAAMTRP